MMLTAMHTPSFMRSFLSMALVTLSLLDVDAAQVGQYQNFYDVHFTMNATHIPRHPYSAVALGDDR